MRSRCARLLRRVGATVQALDDVRSPAVTLLVFAAVMLVAALLTLYQIADPEICKGTEAVEALAVRQMVEHRELLFPVLNASAPVFKPPLFHWTATALAYLAGTQEVTEHTVRLPSALYAMAGVLLTMVFVRRWLGLGSALLAGVLLLASHQYVALGRFGRVDMTLAFCETLALFSALWWLSAKDAADRSATAHYLFAAALGLGVLAKGPVGMILPLLAVVAFLATERRWRDARALCRPGPVMLSLLLASSWYVIGLVAQRYSILDRQIASENFGRFFGSLGSMPPWYYWEPLLTASIPLSWLAPIAVVSALRSPTIPAAPRMLAIFWCVTVLFFSLAAYKRPAYILPLVPASVVLVVWWLGTHAWTEHGRLLRGALIAVCGAMMVGNQLYIRHSRHAACRGGSYRSAASAIDVAVSRTEGLYSHGFDVESISPLLFYLDRTVPPVGHLANGPPGWVLFATRKCGRDPEALALEPVLSVRAGVHRFTLCRRARGAVRREPSAPLPQGGDGLGRLEAAVHALHPD